MLENGTLQDLSIIIIHCPMHTLPILHWPIYTLALFTHCMPCLHTAPFKHSFSVQFIDSSRCSFLAEQYSPCHLHLRSDGQEGFQGAAVLGDAAFARRPCPVKVSAHLRPALEIHEAEMKTVTHSH